MPIHAIGELDRLITIRSRVTSQGPVYGELVETWADWKTAWAYADGAGGRELRAARQIAAEIDMHFQIRWIDGLDTTMRIVHEGRTYDIQRIAEVGRRERLDIYAKLTRP